jgi:hypothetical protein
MSVDSVHSTNAIIKNEVFSIEQGLEEGGGGGGVRGSSSPFGRTKEAESTLSHRESRASYYEKKSMVITGTDSKSADLMFNRCLLFAGIKRPPTRLSPWWLAYIGWRIVLLCGFISIFSNMVSFRHKKPWLIPYCLVPSLLASICAAMSWYWLPKVKRKLVEQGGPEITSHDANQASRLYIWFITINMTLGMTIAVLRYLKTDFAVFLIVIFQQCGTTVILGGVLLLLTIETTLAKKEVRVLLLAARKRKLTRSMYLDGVETIKMRSLRWQYPLNSLAFIAFYCSICLIIIQMFLINKGQIRTNLYSIHDDDEASAIEIEFEIVMILMKEFILLIIFMFLIMGINDEADAITAGPLHTHTFFFFFFFNFHVSLLCTISNLHALPCCFFFFFSNNNSNQSNPTHKCKKTRVAQHFMGRPWISRRVSSSRFTISHHHHHSCTHHQSP